MLSSQKPRRLPDATHDPWTGHGRHVVKYSLCRRTSRSPGARQTGTLQKRQMTQTRSEQLPNVSIGGFGKMADDTIRSRLFADILSKRQDREQRRIIDEFADELDFEPIAQLMISASAWNHVKSIGVALRAVFAHSDIKPDSARQLTSGWLNARRVEDQAGRAGFRSASVGVSGMGFFSGVGGW